jgi:hypothetical protein
VADDGMWGTMCFWVLFYFDLNWCKYMLIRGIIKKKKAKGKTTWPRLESTDIVSSFFLERPCNVGALHVPLDLIFSRTQPLYIQTLIENKRKKQWNSRMMAQARVKRVPTLYSYQHY